MLELVLRHEQHTLRKYRLRDLRTHTLHRQTFSHHDRSATRHRGTHLVPTEEALVFPHAREDVQRANMVLAILVVRRVRRRGKRAMLRRVVHIRRPRLDPDLRHNVRIRDL